jgi:hypothetical protein
LGRWWFQLRLVVVPGVVVGPSVVVGVELGRWWFQLRLLIVVPVIVIGIVVHLPEILIVVVPGVVVVPSVVVGFVVGFVVGVELVRRRFQLRLIVGFVVRRVVFPLHVVVGFVVGVELGRWWFQLRLVVVAVIVVGFVVGFVVIAFLVFVRGLLVQLIVIGVVQQVLVQLGKQLQLLERLRIALCVVQSSGSHHHHLSGPDMIGRRRGDDGAAIIEAAIIMPLLLVVLFGFMEYSNLFKDKMSVANAAHDAAREASQAANFYDADFSTLFIANRSLRSISAGVRKVIVFKASATNDAVPASCLAVVPVAGSPNGVAGVCNVYVGSFVSGISSADRVDFGYVPTGGDKYDKQYPALTRSASRTVTEYVGVYIEASYDHITGAVPTPTVMSSTAITPIEARTA